LLTLQRKAVGEYQANCYILSTPGRENAFLIDPGADPEEILNWSKPHHITKILITHGHQDHVGALAKVRSALRVDVGIHPADAELFAISSDFDLKPGHPISIGDACIEVFHIPGHTPGSIALLVQDHMDPPRAIVGDAIFPGGPGHTSSPVDLRTALDALRSTVFHWPDAVVLYPGHGEETTVGAERAAFEAFTRQPFPPDLCGDVLWR
jgi:hydroxyacylglutathione hydrolase